MELIRNSITRIEMEVHDIICLHIKETFQYLKKLTYISFSNIWVFYNLFTYLQSIDITL